MVAETKRQRSTESFYELMREVSPGPDTRATAAREIRNYWRMTRPLRSGKPNGGAEKQTTVSAAAGGPLAALVAQDTPGQTAP